MGDNTHHQDQLITLHSFSPMNRMVSAPVKPSPPEEDELELIVIVLAVFE
jgi:hypothetical protein